MNGLRKRIGCVVLALFVAVSALLSHPVKVQASSVALPSAGSAESLMALLDLLINAMIAGGASEAVADYDSEMDLLDAFLDFAHNVVPVGEVPEARFYFPDGTTITLDDLETGLQDGTFTLPNEQQWGQYRVGFGDDFASILEAWEQRGGGTGDGGDPQDPKDPEFSTLETLAINSGFLAMVGDFFTSLWNGEIEGIESSAYYEPGFTGNVRTDGVLNLYSTRFLRTDGYWFETVDFKYSGLLAGYLNGKILYIYGTTSHSGSSQWAPCVGSSGTDNYPYYCVNEIYTDIPLFASYDEAKNYLSTGDYTGCLNGLCYDYPALVNSIPAVLAPLTDVQIAPSALQQTYTGMKTAYETEIKPQTKTDPAADTQTYTNTMSQTITDLMPEIAPTPVTDPDQEQVGTETGTDTDSDDDINKYKRDLRSIFPFCLPFDLIALLDALDADPVAPCFEIPFIVDALDISMTVELDLSFLDEVAELMRLFETIGFIITLIMVTHKLIKW